MPKLPGVNHLRAVKALEKAGFRVDRQSKHVFLSKDLIHVVVPRNNPVDAYTMGAIVRAAGMSIEQFRDSFRVDRQSKHVFLSKDLIHVVVPRNNPVDAYTMGAIVRDAGMSIEQFR